MCDDCLASSGLTRRAVLFGAFAGLVALVFSRGRSVRGQGLEPVEVVPGLLINPREAWAERGATGPLQSEDVRFLLVHHTASGNGYGPDGVVPVLRQAFNFHTGPEKGWPDVAYNFFVDRFGGVWEGRQGSLDGSVMADATGGSQGFAQLVCLVGDFTSEMPTDAALESLTRVLAWLADRHGVDTTPGATVEFTSRGSNRWPSGTQVTAATISGHRDMSQTACPGDTFYPYVASELMPRVDALRGGSGPTSTKPPPATSPPTTTTATTTTSAATTTSTTTSTTSTTTTTTTEPPTTSPTAPATPAPATISSPSSASGAVEPAATVPAGATTTDSSSGDGEGSAWVGWTAVGGLVAAAAVIGGRSSLVRSRESSGNDPPPETEAP